MAGIPIASRLLGDLVGRHGGELRGNDGRSVVRHLTSIAHAGAGDLAPLLHARYVPEATAALARGAVLLVDASVTSAAAIPGWIHPHAVFTLAELLDAADVKDEPPVIGPDCTIGQGAVILPRVRLGARVTVAPGAIVGAPGFGFATGRDGKVREIPQLGGVVVEDDVHIGALATVASGTLNPTVLRRGVKLDAQVHIGHNCEIGEGTIIAAQTGIAGSVVVGRGVMMGGQVGIADHVVVGDGARIAAKSGVIGDVAAGATVAGYPAVARHRWLRGLAEMYKLVSARDATSMPPPPSVPTPSSIPYGAPRSVTPMPAALHPAAVIRRPDETKNR